MTLAEFIAQFRKDRDDALPPYLWSTAEVRDYLNEALNEACERALLIEDSSATAACSQITLVAGQASYALHESVIKVKRVVYDDKPISETSVEMLDRDDAFWATRTGVPDKYVLANMGTLRVTPTPTAAAVANAPTLYLTVYRKPLTAISEDTDDEADFSTLFSIPKLYHMRLLDWVYRCALRKNDTETIDLDGSKGYEAAFIGSFGERPDANVQRKRRDKRPPIVRCAW
jgi:hypothetical protein